MNNETRIKMRKASKERWKTKTKNPHNKQWNEKIRDSLLGDKNPNYGKHLSEHTKKLIGLANKGRKWKGGLAASRTRRRELGYNI